jgi:hypothetical protein
MQIESWFGSGVLAAIVCLPGCATVSPEPSPGNCPVCGKPVADGPEVRVILPDQTGPGIRYRCFMCPIMEGTLPDSWTLRAVSGVDGKWVSFHVRGDRVDSDPPTAVVLALPVGPGEECLDVHRVFVDQGEFERYLATRPAMKNARSRTLEDVLKTHGK